MVLLLARDAAFYSSYPAFATQMSQFGLFLTLLSHSFFSNHPSVCVVQRVGAKGCFCNSTQCLRVFKKKKKKKRLMGSQSGPFFSWRVFFGHPKKSFFWARAPAVHNGARLLCICWGCKTAEKEGKGGGSYMETKLTRHDFVGRRHPPTNSQAQLDRYFRRGQVCDAR